MTPNKTANILLVEDNEGDIELTREAFSDDASLKSNLHIVTDGEMALDYLFKRNSYEDATTPDIILMDLNLPKAGGREVLEIIKNDTALKRIPAIILTSSSAPQDIADSYDRHANCYIVKPIDGLKFMDVVRQVEHFWINIACPTEST